MLKIKKVIRIKLFLFFIHGFVFPLFFGSINWANNHKLDRSINFIPMDIIKSKVFIVEFQPKNYWYIDSKIKLLGSVKKFLF